MKANATPTAQRQATNVNVYSHARIANEQNRKFHPASRTERLASWNRRMQSLFTRQAY